MNLYDWVTHQMQNFFKKKKMWTFVSNESSVIIWDDVVNVLRVIFDEKIKKQGNGIVEC